MNHTPSDLRDGSPILSVIIPVYNVENYLPNCLASIANQSFGAEKFEIILVNDGSTDRSGAICHDFAADHGNVTVIDQDNQGQSVARNEGLKVATGEYLLFLDSDDALHQLTVEECLACFSADPDLDMVLFEQQDWSESAFTAPLPEGMGSRTMDTAELRRGYLEDPGGYVSVTRRITKRSIVGDITFIPNVKFEDNPFTWELLGRAQRAVYLHPAPFLLRVTRPDSTTAQVRAAYNLDHLRFGEEIFRDAVQTRGLEISAHRYRLGLYTYRVLVIMDHPDFREMPDYAELTHFFDRCSVKYLRTYSKSPQRFVYSVLFKYSPETLRVIRKGIRAGKVAKKKVFG